MIDFVSFEGSGIHTGKHCTGKILTNENLSKCNFIKSGNLLIPAIIENAKPIWGSTVLSYNDVNIYTIEHLFAVMFAGNYWNVTIEIDGNEIPIGDGSGSFWVEKLSPVNQVNSQYYYSIIKDGLWEYGDSYLKVIPDNKLNIHVIVEFPSYPFLNGKIDWDGSKEYFYKEIAPSRTFAVINEALEQIDMGLAKGGNLDNAVVFNSNGELLGKNELRFKDEPVRHKLLDFIGDLSLLGAPIKGDITIYKPGHRANIELLKQLKVNCYIHHHNIY